MTVKKDIQKSVLDYLNAAVNLYYYIPIKKLLEIYNSQNEPLTREEFCDIIEQILKERQFFDLFSEDEIAIGKPDDAPTSEKILLAEHLYCMGDFDDYFELKEATYGLPYHILDKNSFLKYADEFYVEKTLEFISLRAYFRNFSSLSREDADDLAFEAADTLRISGGDPKYILDRMECLKISPKNQREFDELMKLFGDLSRKVRLASLRGATIEEMQD